MRYIYSLLVFLFLGTSFIGYSQSKGFEEIKNLKIISLIYENLDKYFVDNPQIGKITKVGIDAMLDQLDPYTVYYPQSDIEDYRLMTTGQYGGIGALIRKIGDYVVIAEPYKNRPADKAGLKPGDRILSIDGRSMKGKSSQELSEALKGPKGSSFTLKIKRPNKGTKTISITRDEIKLHDIPYSGMIDKKQKVGYIKLKSFTNTASKSVIAAFQKLEEKGMQKLILDLRGNGGGLLREAINIVNIFVPKNTTIVKTKGRVIEENKAYKTRNKPLDLEIPVVVLINGRSASASEIVSGSLQDLDRAVVIGRNSFGKGLVQRTVDLAYGAKMKLTIAKYYTPSGRCVQRLDYYHTHDGKRVEEVPDSLINIFHTKNGREVISGRGIDPDIKVEPDSFSKLAAVLMGDNIIFNFATQFTQNHKKIAPPNEFKISDSIYASFKKYVLQQDFEYESHTQILLEKVLEAAKKEGYDKKIDGEYDALYNVLKVSKKEDLDLFADQIKMLLSSEIVMRYYYQKGRAINSFQHDQTVKKAIEVLNNQKQYHSILNPQ